MGELLHSGVDGNVYNQSQVDAGMTRLEAYANDPDNPDLVLVADETRTANRTWDGIVHNAGSLAMSDEGVWDTPDGRVPYPRLGPEYWLG